MGYTADRAGYHRDFAGLLPVVSRASIIHVEHIHLTRQLRLLNQLGVDVWVHRTTDRLWSAASAVPVSPPETDDIPGRDSLVPTSLEEIEKAVRSCEKCQLHQTRTRTVFGSGCPDADWLFVGEAPGAQEDRQGKPFVGRAGKLLDLMIAALGLHRSEVYIANVLKCRPPNNRDPRPDEVVQCEHYLQHQLALVRPKIIVALGLTATRALLKTNRGFRELRGSVHAYGDQDIPLVATYHPAYLLRNPGQKSKSWEDLWLAKTSIQAS